MTITPGLVIDGKYAITRLIGEGGMGAVYEGTNVLIRRRVAIKVLLASMRDAGGRVVERFEREAQAAGCIGNDHILEVLDLGTLPSGDRYMVMEFLDGEPLSDRIRRLGRLTPEQAAPLLRQALVGLDAAHRAGIIHRDLKPDNIFILREKAGRSDYVKIIDFGISKFGALTGDLSMTSTGAVMGTPYYMSPEQAKGAGGVTHQSDLYSMGVIAFEAVTGQVPFDGSSFNDLMFKIVLGEMPEPEKLAPGLDPVFAGIIKRAMARNPADRFQSAEEFIAVLDAWRPAGRTLAAGTPLQTEALEAPAAPTGVGAGTNLDWAASQSDAEAPKRAGLIVPLAAGLGALLVVGAAVAFWSGGDPSTDDEAEAPVAAAEPIAEATQEAPPAAVPEAAPEVPEPAEEKDDEPEPAAQESEPPAKAPTAKAPAVKQSATKSSATNKEPAKPRTGGRDFGY